MPRMRPPKYPSSCVERFLEYVTFDTQSSESSDTFPSTEKQLVFLRRLVRELEQLGLQDVTMDQHGYVFATIEATSSKPNVPVIGFLAHVDTSPEMSGAGVKPIVHRNYQGQDLVLPDDPSAVISLAQNPWLEEHWHDVHTAFAVYARDALTAKLPEGLRARVEENLIISLDRSPTQYRPDVTVSKTSAPRLGEIDDESGLTYAEEVLVIDIAETPQ